MLDLIALFIILGGIRRLERIKNGDTFVQKWAEEVSKRPPEEKKVKDDPFGSSLAYFILHSMVSFPLYEPFADRNLDWAWLAFWLLPVVLVTLWCFLIAPREKE